MASSCLDEETVTSFIAFIQQNLAKLIRPDEILAAKKFKSQVYTPIKKIVKKDVLRVDIIATLCTRMINYLIIQDITPNEKEIKNIRDFIKMDIIPNDLRLALLQDIVVEPKLKGIMADPDVALLLLEKM